MLVEDDKSLREIYGIRMIAEGYEIVSAGDGEEALALAVKERPDLILSDVMMPKISGFDMLDILRATPETKDIKVIMMTALSSEAQRARGEALGANRYLVKSQVGIEDVVRAVKEVLEGIIETPPSDTPTHVQPETVDTTAANVGSMTSEAPMQILPEQPVDNQETQLPQPLAGVSDSQAPTPQATMPDTQPEYVQPQTPPSNA